MRCVQPPATQHRARVALTSPSPQNVNVVYRLAIAFVRYRVRASAEFAKVGPSALLVLASRPPPTLYPPPCPFAAAQIAMEGQSLDGDELLNVRWAHDDPNPVAKNAVRSPPALPLGQTVSCPRMTPLPCLSPMRLAPRSSARTRTPWWP